MRQSIKKLIEDSFVLRYKLPIDTIDKTPLTTLNDYCFEADDNGVANAIYNSIIDFCLNEAEIDILKLQSHQIFALKNRLRYSPNDKLDVQLKYGFFGEVLLNILLKVFFHTDKIIAKGFFYNPIKKSEIEGYDSFHFVEKNGELEFWFGEAKMYSSFPSAFRKILENINKALSNKYYEDNLMAILSRKNDLDKIKQGSLLEELLNKLKNGDVEIIKELNNHNVKTVYPILIAYDCTAITFEDKIRKSVVYIYKTIKSFKLINEIYAELLFLFVPVDSVADIKKEVLKWISEAKHVT